MSVSRSEGEQSTAYDDLDVQIITANFDIEANNSAVIRQDHEPVAGSLSRNEVAELVAMKAVVFINAQQGPGDQNTQIHGRYQFGTTPNVEFNHSGFGYGSATASDAEVIDTDTGFTASQLTSNYTSSIENDVFLVLQPHQDAQGLDTAAGVGFGGTKHMAHEHIEFRDMFGRGPEVDRHVTLYEIGNLDTANIAGSLYRVLQLYWDVRTED